MNPHVNTMSNRLSLWPPQRDSLKILARLCEIVPLQKDGDAAQALEIIKSDSQIHYRFDDSYSKCLVFD